jgi:hypothetical protein
MHFATAFDVMKAHIEKKPCTYPNVSLPVKRSQNHEYFTAK